MKKLVMSILVLTISGAMLAQNKKGNKLVGVSIGSGSFSSGKYDYMYSSTTTEYTGDSKDFNIGINPSVGCYLTDMFVLGASLSLSYNSGKDNSANSSTTTTSSSESNSLYFSVGPFARLYLGKNNPKGMPYVQLNTGLSFYPSDGGESFNSTETYHYTYKTRKYFAWDIGPRFGYEHFFNDNIGLHYYIGYNYSKYKYSYEYDYTVGGTDFSYDYNAHSHNIVFGVGLQIHMDCKKNRK